jgi:copper chaperone NosL
MQHDGPHVDRRTVIGAFGTGAVLALAGCAGGDDGEEGDDETTADDDANGEDGDGDGEPTPLAEPTAFPDGEACAVCNMITADHPDWNAQLVHEDETRTYFCSSGCMAAYYVDPERFDGPDAAVSNVWVTGYESRELVDASEAHFVRITDSGHVDDVMMMNPTPFADRADAEAFVAEFDEYGEADIIGLEAFDMDLATLYRGRLFESSEG